MMTADQTPESIILPHVHRDTALPVPNDPDALDTSTTDGIASVLVLAGKVPSCGIAGWWRGYVGVPADHPWAKAVRWGAWAQLERTADEFAEGAGRPASWCCVEPDGVSTRRGRRGEPGLVWLGWDDACDRSLTHVQATQMQADLVAAAHRADAAERRRRDLAESLLTLERDRPRPNTVPMHDRPTDCPIVVSVNATAAIAESDRTPHRGMQHRIAHATIRQDAVAGELTFDHEETTP